MQPSAAYFMQPSAPLDDRSMPKCWAQTCLERLIPNTVFKGPPKLWCGACCPTRKSASHALTSLLACEQVKHRVPSTAVSGPIVGAAVSQHAAFVSSHGVRLVNTTAAPLRGPRSVLHAPFADLARHLSQEV